MSYMAAVDHGIFISAFVSRMRVLVREWATCISAVSPLRSTVVHERETWALPAHLLRFSNAMRCSGDCFDSMRRHCFPINGEQAQCRRKMRRCAVCRKCCQRTPAAPSHFERQSPTRVPDFILNLPPYTYSDIKLPCLEMSAQLVGPSSAFISCARRCSTLAQCDGAHLPETRLVPCRYPSRRDMLSLPSFLLCSVVKGSACPPFLTR